MKQLIEKAQLGDGDAFAEAVISMQASLYRMARVYLKSEDDIADAIQETILKAWKSISELENPAFFKTWMIRILIHEALKILGKQKREVPLEQDSAAGQDQAAASFAEQVSDRKEWQPGHGLEFEEMMEVLSEPFREVFVLYYGEDMSSPEIAQILNISEETVRQRLSRGRRIIRELYL